MSSAADNDNNEPVAEEISLSVEETNRLRISLGLRPLDEGRGGGSAESNKKAAQNFDNEKKRMVARTKRKEVMERLAKEQNAEKLNAKLQGRGLGDQSDDEDDSMAWARKHKSSVKQNKLEAEKKARELEEMESEDKGYSAADLKGLRVAHELGDITHEVLVLADKNILGDDDNEDELISMAISDKERLKKNLENKKKKTGYNPHEVEEEESFTGVKKILGKYDDDEPVRIGFVIGQEDVETEETRLAKVAQNLKGMAENLEYEKMREVKDYYTNEEVVAILKPKKKKKKAKARAKEVGDWPTVEEEDGERGDAMDIDAPNGPSKPKTTVEKFSKSNKNAKIDDVNFVDDDDLQAVLSRARRLAHQTRATAPQTLLEMPAAADEDDDDIGDDGDRLILSATSEFINNLSSAPIFKSAPTESSTAARRISGMELDDDDDDQVKQEDDDDDDVDRIKNRWGIEGDGVSERDDDNMSGARSRSTEVKIKSEDLQGAIVEEPLVSSGMAAALSLLKQKGFIEKATVELQEKERKQMGKAKWLAEQRLKDKIRELEREKEKQRNRELNKSKGGRGGGHQDEWQHEEDNRVAERQRLRELELKFKNYNPDVEIKYHDEFGRSLNAKEAFRFLSHKFHGKTSGKMKTEKRLLKMDEEIKLQQMLSNDTPLTSSDTDKLKAARTAHVVLSVGNRGVLPADVSISDVGTSSKHGSSGKGKGSTSSSGKKFGSTLLSSSAPLMVPSTVIDASAVVPTGKREKVAFGLGGGIKRKAEDDSNFEDALSKRSKE